MAELNNMQDLRWSVHCFNRANDYRWLYTFKSNNTVTWLDENNKLSGSGTWKIKGGALVTTWANSSTVETWDLPIETTGWHGRCKMKGIDHQLFATARNYSEYRAIKAEGQIHDWACWAACLAWMTRTIKGSPEKAQNQIFIENRGRLLSDGSISIDGLMTVNMSGIYNLRKERVSVKILEERIRSRPFPMLIAFKSGPYGGHVNVIHGFDETSGNVQVMEPWSPDPTNNKNYRFTVDRVDGYTVERYKHAVSNSYFTFTGAHVERPIGYYTRNPLNGGFLIAFPEPVKK